MQRSLHKCQTIFGFFVVSLINFTNCEIMGKCLGGILDGTARKRAYSES